MRHHTPVLIHESVTWLVQQFFHHHSHSQVFVLTDHHTQAHCYPLVKDHLPPHQTLIVKPGEAHKNLDTCVAIWKFLTDGQADRQSLVFVLGGGVLGDMGGFCAATYKRGVDFVLMPTTLLAQVDASVGGKLGIDFYQLKNHLGVFQLPAQTLISPAFLSTLPRRELRSGFAEVIKHCLISDADAWEALISNPFGEHDWMPWIQHSVSFKERVITEDPKERGLRKILNFGHTVGHALESYYLTHEQPVFHGEAIAAGMIVESFIAEQKGLLSRAELDSIVRYLMLTFGKIDTAFYDEALLQLMLQDKKNNDKRILIALPEGIGKARWDVETSATEIKDGLSFYRQC